MSYVWTHKKVTTTAKNYICMHIPRDFRSLRSMPHPHDVMFMTILAGFMRKEPPASACIGSVVGQVTRPMGARGE